MTIILPFTHKQGLILLFSLGIIACIYSTLYIINNQSNLKSDNPVHLVFILGWTDVLSISILQMIYHFPKIEFKHKKEEVKK